MIPGMKLGRMCFTLTAALLAATSELNHALAAGPVLPDPPATECELRLAHSTDGIAFTDTGQVLCRGATSPDVTLLPNGRLLVIYDEISKSSKAGETHLAVAASADNGKTWSAPRRINITAQDGRRIAGRHADAILPRPDHLRLYFEVAEQPHDGRASRHTSRLIQSAVTRNGVDYRLDPAVRLEMRDAENLDITTLAMGNDLHLFAGSMRSADKNNAPRCVIQRFISRDGRRFAKTGSSTADDGVLIASAIEGDRAITGYGTTDAGIAVFESRDGRRWERIGDTKLPGGSAPAVVRLRKGGYLMVYCRTEDTNAPAGQPMIPRTIEAPDGTGLASSSRDEQGVESRGARSGDDLAELSAAAGGGAALSNLDLRELAPDEAFAPLPDFTDYVDYVKWIRDELRPPGPNDAGRAYESFMPDLDGYSPDGTPWPDMPNMFEDNDLANAPMPWEPELHPDWEAGRLAGQDVLNAYRNATRLEGYHNPLRFSDIDNDGKEDDELMISLMLPNLSNHRALAKMTLANGWRAADDGQPPVDQMLDGWETVLRDAEHLHEGPTLIEHLVGLSEQNIVERDARWALQRGVFDNEQEIDRAIEILEQFDLEPVDPAQYVRGEHAMTLDLMQYTFSPAAADGLPQVNEEHFQKVAGFVGEEWQKSIEQARSLDPHEVLDTIDAVDSYYRGLADSMRVGYPLVRGSDIDEEGARIAARNPITNAVIPALGKVHQMRTWSETGRRATRLSYEIHRYKARTGRWPATLDELPIEPGSVIRTDPLTGGDFAYGVGSDGPTIYSLGENALDDGGIHNPQRMAEWTESTVSDDYVFWPPQAK